MWIEVAIGGRATIDMRSIMLDRLAEYIKSGRQRISTMVNVGSVTGLVVPAKAKKDLFPFFWVSDDLKAPGVIRFSWHPISGEIRIRSYGQHAADMGVKDKQEEWLRGFYFPKEKHLVLRPYALDVYSFDKELNDIVTKKFLLAVKPSLKTDPTKKPIKTITDIHDQYVSNQGLASKYGKHGWSW